MNTLDRPRISAANIVIKKPAGTDPVIERLKRLHATCTAGGNKNDTAVALITACLEEGVDTRARIIGALEPLGFNYKHIAIMLQRGTGNTPERDRWRLDMAGRYHLHA